MKRAESERPPSQEGTTTWLLRSPRARKVGGKEKEENPLGTCRRTIGIS
jgi:hypothetical protein